MHCSSEISYVCFRNLCPGIGVPNPRFGGIDQILWQFIGAYRGRRDCLKCVVFCYTFSCWEFGRSLWHCMEFKITMDKIAQWNKMLLFWNKHIHTSHSFCCPFGLFHRFWGVLRCLSQLSIKLSVLLDVFSFQIPLRVLANQRPLLWRYPGYPLVNYSSDRSECQ